MIGLQTCVGARRKFSRLTILGHCRVISHQKDLLVSQKVFHVMVYAFLQKPERGQGWTSQLQRYYYLNQALLRHKERWHQRHWIARKPQSNLLRTKLKRRGPGANERWYCLCAVLRKSSGVGHEMKSNVQFVFDTMRAGIFIYKAKPLYTRLYPEAAAKYFNRNTECTLCDMSLMLHISWRHTPPPQTQSYNVNLASRTFQRSSKNVFHPTTHFINKAIKWGKQCLHYAAVINCFTTPVVCSVLGGPTLVGPRCSRVSLWVFVSVRFSAGSDSLLSQTQPEIMI